MSYDNESIRAISDIVTDSDRTIAVIDNSKLKYISIDTLKTTAAELALNYRVVEGQDDERKPTSFLIVAEDDVVLSDWEIEMSYTHLFGNTPAERMRLQIRTGKALGYNSTDILDFLTTEVARTCPCTSCGGDLMQTEITGVIS
jgi:hypothetical protein